MRTEERIKEFVTKQNYKVYIANDGTEFTTEKECQKYDDGAECAYKTLLSKVMKPIMGSFNYNDTKDHPELVNVYKNIIDDIFEDGRRECEYYTFRPSSEEDVKNFLALTKVQDASIRYSFYKNEAILNPFVQLEHIEKGKLYILIYYPEGISYTIIEPEQYTKSIISLINRVL